MFSKSFKLFLGTVLVFSLLVLASPVSAQTESMDEMSQEFEEQMQQVEEEMNQTTDSMDEEFESTTEEMDQEFEENVQEAQEEWEAYNQELQEQFDQDQEEYEANREEILKIIDKQQGIFERIFGFFAVGGVLITIFAILIIVLSLGGLIFDIVMIIDCLNREFKDKTLWLIILIGGGLIGLGLVVSVVYYFAVKRKLDSDK